MLFDMKTYRWASYNFESDNWGSCSKEECMQANYEYKLFNSLCNCLELLIKKGNLSSNVVKKRLYDCIEKDRNSFLKNSALSIKKGTLSAELKLRAFKQVNIVLEDKIEEYLSNNN